MNAKKTLVSVRRLIMATAVAAGCTLSLAPVSARADLAEDLEAAQAKLEEMRTATEEAANRLEDVQGELEVTGEEIAEVKRVIVQKRGELDDAKGVLAQIVQSSYKNDTSFLSIIFSSTSFDEFISNLYYANKVAEDRARAVDAVRAIRDELAAQRDELEQKQTEQRQLVEEQTARLASLTDAQEEQSAYVDGLSAELQAQIEAARRAEEEAAAAAAAAAMEAERAAAASAQGAAPSESAGSGQTGGGAETPSAGGGSSSVSLPTETGGSFSSGVKQAAVQAALSVLGTPYSTPTPNIPYQFDCSGLVWWAYRQAGVSIPRSQRSGMYPQVRASGTWTSDLSKLAVGDLLFYSYDGGASTFHVALYLGGGQVVHADGTRVSIGGVSGSFIGGGSII